MGRETTRRFGLYWNRSGELYHVGRAISVPWELETCRVHNLSTGSWSIQPCADAIDRHIEVGWYVPCTLEDLKVAFESVNVEERWQKYYGANDGT